MERDGGLGLGGILLFADLAGAEYLNPVTATSKSAGGDQRTAAEVRQVKEINSSLLALKECIRGLARPSSSTARIPFRNSKLTLVLREHLLGGRDGTMMVANVSGAVSQIKGTANTLQYASTMMSSGK
jgi:hypothetical protein